VEFGKGVEIPLKQPPVHDVVHDVIDDGFSQNVEEVTSPGLLPPLLGFCSFLCPFSGCRGKVPFALRPVVEVNGAATTCGGCGSPPPCVSIAPFPLGLGQFFKRELRLGFRLEA